MMVSLDEFREQFTERHEFVYSDLNVLKKRFKHISFRDIPEAWVYAIDKTLSMMNQRRRIKSISQVYGFLVVDCARMSDFDRNLLKTLELELKVLDIDLHEKIEEGIILH
jgi:hypothetical protein